MLVVIGTQGTGKLAMFESFLGEMIIGLAYAVKWCGLNEFFARFNEKRKHKKLHANLNSCMNSKQLQDRPTEHKYRQ